MITEREEMHLLYEVIIRYDTTEERRRNKKYFFLTQQLTPSNALRLISPLLLHFLSVIHFSKVAKACSLVLKVTYKKWCVSWYFEKCWKLTTKCSALETAVKSLFIHLKNKVPEYFCASSFRRGGIPQFLKVKSTK